MTKLRDVESRIGEVLGSLRAMADPSRLEGMARYAIPIGNALGVSMPPLRAFARKLGRDHGLALELWASGVHEARILASMVDDPAVVPAEQMDAWVWELEGWDLCDQCCLNLFRKTPHAWAKAMEWSGLDDPPLFVRRAGFSLMACLAVHDKAAPDEAFEPVIERALLRSSDDRRMARKAVSWALRQTGKRNMALRARVLEALEPLTADRAAAPLAREVIRELNDANILSRMQSRQARRSGKGRLPRP